jgi:hypothetical protein
MSPSSPFIGVLRRRSPLPFAVLAGAIGLIGVIGCAGPSARSAAAARDRAPVSRHVSRTEVMTLANAAADQRPGGFVVVIDTDDMLPGYPRGTAVVIEPVAYADLREGMIVLFHRRDGTGCCTHVLVMKTPDGWITRGTSARGDDPQPMTTENYVGQVVAAFTADLPATAAD